MSDTHNLPGSDGEHFMQEKFETTLRAKEFYDREMRDFLSSSQQEFIKKQGMVFISTSDGHGECDSSFRSGEDGFVRILDNKTLAYPDYRGSGVLASTGNMHENPNIGMLFIDFFDARIGLHVNGKVQIMEKLSFDKFIEEKNFDFVQEKIKQEIVFWIVIDIEESYIHCSKNIPLLTKV